MLVSLTIECCHDLQKTKEDWQITIEDKRLLHLVLVDSINKDLVVAFCGGLSMTVSGRVLKRMADG